MAKLDLLVKNGEVWTPGGFVAADIAVHGGKVIALGQPPVLPDTADEVIDAKGKKVIPGLIDTHTHHRDPGFTHKEDITTATMAAAAGGVTTSIGMPNVNPPTTTVERYRALIEHHSKNAIVDFNHNPSGTVPEEIPGLAKEGPLAFKIFMVKDTGRDYPHMPGIGINNNGELFKCFETVGNTGLPLMVHPHDQDLMDEIEGRYWKKEDRSPQAYAKAYRDYDGIIWDTAMATLFRMQKALGARLHILHMTTPEGIAMLRRAKDEGRPCSCEVNPWAMFLGTWGKLEKMGTVALGLRGHRPMSMGCGKKRSMILELLNDRDRSCTAHKRRERSWLVRYVELSGGELQIQDYLSLFLDAVSPGSCQSIAWCGSRHSIRPRFLTSIRRRVCCSPGSDADIVIVDMNKKEVISVRDHCTEVGWTPYTSEKSKECRYLHHFLVARPSCKTARSSASPAVGQLVKPVS